MSGLDAALRPLASLLNRNIRAMTPARELCRKLAGKVIALRVRSSALATYFTISDDGVALSSQVADEPDAVISGSPIALLGLLRGAGAAAIRDGELDLTGDAEIAQQFGELMQFAKPDVEEELSQLVGDMAAHRLGEFARGVGRWGRDARSTVAANIREYLQEESRDTPSRYEVERFSLDVGDLRDAVERAAARLSRLEARD